MPAWVVPAIMGAVQLAGTAAQMWSSNQGGKDALKIAKFQAKANQSYLDQQLAYNHPSAQMQRLREAGLNPHLVYGQGSSGASGNQSSPLTYPDYKAPDYSQATASIGRVAEAVGLFNSTRLVDSQVSAKNAETVKNTVLTDLARVQKQVMEKNPALNDAGYKAMIDSLIWSANIKASQSDIQSETASWFKGTIDPNTAGPGVQKLQKEFEVLQQRFRLNELDAKLKAEVLTSKEFQNAILEVQKRFMTEGDISPQHIYQFIQLLLMKSL